MIADTRFEPFTPRLSRVSRVAKFEGNGSPKNGWQKDWEQLAKPHAKAAKVAKDFGRGAVQNGHGEFAPRDPALLLLHRTASRCRGVHLLCEEPVDAFGKETAGETGLEISSEK